MNAFAAAQANRDFSEAPEYWEETAPEITTDYLCDKVAGNWLMGGGDVELWVKSVPEITTMINAVIGPEYDCLLGEVAETWTEHGGDADGLRCCSKQIQSWITTHAAAVKIAAQSR